jgi:hypothetical protein
MSLEYSGSLFHVHAVLADEVSKRGAVQQDDVRGGQDGVGGCEVAEIHGEDVTSHAGGEGVGVGWEQACGEEASAQSSCHDDLHGPWGVVVIYW